VIPPCDRPAALATHAGGEPFYPGSRPPRVILLVEDSEDDADLTLRAFRNSGVPCKIVLAQDGKQALDYIFARGDWVDRDAHLLPTLVLLDLKLPCLGGLEVLRQLRQSPKTDHLPIVVMSCSNEITDIQASYTLGANSYIRKPVDFVEFEETVELIGRYWLAVNQTASEKDGPL
jgi:two-component system response regulator